MLCFATLAACGGGTHEASCGGPNQVCCQGTSQCTGAEVCNGKTNFCEIPTLCHRDSTLAACIGLPTDPDVKRCAQDVPRTCVDGCCEHCGGSGEPCCGNDRCTLGFACAGGACTDVPP